jgi:hypothetical protein
MKADIWFHGNEEPSEDLMQRTYFARLSRTPGGPGLGEEAMG